MKIWKYNLRITDTQSICLPENARILSAQMQNNELYIWVLHDKDYSSEVRHFAIYGTGHDIPENPGFPIASVQQVFGGGSLVWHLFEVYK
jgi:hypothetical protein